MKVVRTRSSSAITRLTPRSPSCRARVSCGAAGGGWRAADLGMQLSLLSLKEEHVQRLQYIVSCACTGTGWPRVAADLDIAVDNALRMQVGHAGANLRKQGPHRGCVEITTSCPPPPDLGVQVARGRELQHHEERPPSSVAPVVAQAPNDGRVPHSRQHLVFLHQILPVTELGDPPLLDGDRPTGRSVPGQVHAAMSTPRQLTQQHKVLRLEWPLKHGEEGPLPPPGGADKWARRRDQRRPPSPQGARVCPAYCPGALLCSGTGRSAAQ